MESLYERFHEEVDSIYVHNDSRIAIHGSLQLRAPITSFRTNSQHEQRENPLKQESFFWVRAPAPHPCFASHLRRRRNRVRHRAAMRVRVSGGINPRLRRSTVRFRFAASSAFVCVWPRPFGTFKGPNANEGRRFGFARRYARFCLFRGGPPHQKQREYRAKPAGKASISHSDPAQRGA